MGWVRDRNDRPISRRRNRLPYGKAFSCLRIDWFLASSEVDTKTIQSRREHDTASKIISIKHPDVEKALQTLRPNHGWDGMEIDHRKSRTMPKRVWRGNDVPSRVAWDPRALWNGVNSLRWQIYLVRLKRTRKCLSSLMKIKEIRHF